MKVTPLGKLLILILAVGLAMGGARYWKNLAPAAATKGSEVPKKVDLPGSDAPNSGSTGSTGSVVPMPISAEAGCTDKPEVRLLGYAWNAQMGMLLATGGPQATRGSAMCSHGVNFRFQRQDDNGKLQEALVSFATDLSRGNSNPSKGAHFVTIMGDGGAAFLQGLNSALKRLGPEYQAKIVDAIGYSRGEDKFMGPSDWKADPQTSKGGVVAGVLRDGDWNIAQKWLGDNGLKTNPDEKTWDPDALNWVAADDYIDASQKYISGYSEDRPVVRDGKRTGETKHITVNGVVTWTPGDVIVAEKKGGLVSIISTKEYSSQMPCVVIGIDKWMRQNRSTVENMIQAIAEGSDLVKSSGAGLKRAASISNAVYHEKDTDPSYWEKYFKGTTESDKTGQSVELGGSSVNSLADSLVAFGLVPGSANLVGTTYRVFGDLVVSQYPELVPSYPAPDDVIDTSYLKDVQNKTRLSPSLIAKAQPTYKPAPPSNNGGGGNRNAPRVLSRRVWNINFAPNSASFTPEAQRSLQQLTRDLLVASGTTIEVDGHTDNQGNNPGKSMVLSKARALAVQQYLERAAPVNFPRGRITALWFGETRPIDPGNNPQAWAKNRRVEIVLRSAA